MAKIIMLPGNNAMVELGIILIVMWSKRPMMGFCLVQKFFLMNLAQIIMEKVIFVS